MENNILAQTNKPELTQYLHVSLFIPTASLLNATKQDFPNTWPGLIEKLIKKHLEKSGNKKMGHLHTRRQGLQSTREKPPYTDLEEKRKNVVFCTTVKPITTEEGKYTQIYADASPSHLAE